MQPLRRFSPNVTGVLRLASVAHDPSTELFTTVIQSLGSDPMEIACVRFELRLSTDNVEYYTDIDRDGHEISRFGGLPRELYFPEVHSTEGNIVPRENTTILATPTHDILSVPVDICYIRWSK